MPYLTREQILEADDTKYREVEVPEWGGTVLVKSLTGREREKFEEAQVKFTNGKREMNFRYYRARLVAKAVVDGPGGKPVFTEDDLHALSQRNVAPLDRIFNVAMQLSGMTKDDVDDLVKNSESDQSDDSGSD